VTRAEALLAGWAVLTAIVGVLAVLIVTRSRGRRRRRRTGAGRRR
jgi:hypothetical protein